MHMARSNPLQVDKQQASVCMTPHERSTAAWMPEGKLTTELSWTASAGRVMYSNLARCKHHAAYLTASCKQ